MLYITDIVRNQKHVLTTSDVSDIELFFVVKLRSQIIDTNFFDTQLHLNEYDSNFLRKIELYELKENCNKKNTHDNGW